MTQKLTPKQQKALIVFLDGGNDSEAAAAAGVRRETVNGWKNKPEFQAEFDKQFQELIPAATGNMIASLGECVSYLRSVVGDDEISHTLRIRAALGLMDKALRFKEQTEILARLEALEGLSQ